MIALLPALHSCKGKSEKPPFDIKVNAPQAGKVVSVPYEELGGVKTIPVKINGVSMDMIYDTGCSGIQISLHELQTLLKNGKISQDDVLGMDYAQIADGTVVENGRIRLRSVTISGEGGSVELHDLEASVALNLEAPVLLGNTVADELASVEVDNVKKAIKFHKR